jgi:hypothetical protein
MKILYDMQEDFSGLEPGDFEKHGIISLRRDPDAYGRIEKVEDIKVLLISGRTARESGIYININELDGLLPGDRINVTGRIDQDHSLGSSTWSISLFSVIDGHLTHHIAPGAVYSLSYILDENDVQDILTVHTIGWGVLHPLMDFYIDNILITRDDSVGDSADTRKIIYSLAADSDVQLINADKFDKYGTAVILARSGHPNVKIMRHNESTALNINTRVNDWDGLDIIISNLKLRVGNQYKITVHGQVDGEAPEGSIIMIQGVPSYSWRHNIEIKSNEKFTLEYLMTRSDVETWTSARITTNPAGAKMAFFVYNIEIERV